MKFDPLVKVRENKLVKISDNSEISVENLNVVQLKNIAVEAAGKKDRLTACVCSWSEVELSEGNYNEELLAKFRDYLKKIEEKSSYAFIVPKAEKSFADADQADSFIKSMVHLARRVKDCTSVVGFALASELLEKDAGKTLDENSWSQWFINEMNVKHSHYVYFASAADLKKYGLEGRTCTNELVIY